MITRDGSETAQPGAEGRMTLLEHLSELRVRLWKCTLAVALLGGVSLWKAREVFGLLMKPVLAALPEESRALVYTSGIEEINVLLKVGLYAGIFLAAPVILYQLWGFIAPGLYQHEKRMIAPFVTLGTLFFVGGAVFCYLAVLPTMFKFLLTEDDEHEVRHRAVIARAHDADAARLLAAGALPLAQPLIDEGRKVLLAHGDGQVDEASDGPLRSPSTEEVKTRDQLLSARLDLAVPLAQKAGEPARLALQQALTSRDAATVLLENGDPVRAAQKLDEAAKATGQVFELALGGGYGKAFDDLWRLDRHIGVAVRREAALEWTRPMLTMTEQLSLVLLLEVAFGIIFELPLIMSLITWLGLVDFKLLAKYQRHAVLLCVVLAAIITPSGDAVNLALMAVPMIVCYELGVLASFFISRSKAKAASKPPPSLKVVS